MRFGALITFALASTALGAVNKKTVIAAPDVEVAAKFPDSNAFGRVTNGESSNLLNLRLTSHANEQIVITKVHGQFHEAGGRERPLRNTTNMALQQPVDPNGKSPIIPYKFHSENKPGEVGLRVWVTYLDSGKKSHTVLGYEGNVTIVEPKGSWFDPALLFLYLILGGFFYIVGSLVYSSYTEAAAAANKKASGGGKSKRAPLPAPVDDGPKGVDEEWIPEHILRQRKVKGTAAEGATSGSESEGGKKAKKGRK